MSTLKVEIVQIEEVLKHENADRLEVCVIKGWNCVTGKDNFKKGDLAVYFPIDSILPQELEAKLFPADAKIKLHKSRIKTIKIRGAYSQGLLVKTKELGFEGRAIGDDLTQELGVTKYEPKPDNSGFGALGRVRKIRKENPNFSKYTDIENWKNYNKLFRDGEMVSVTEKVHGTNARWGWVPFAAKTFLEKVLKFLHLAPKYEFVYGSHNVQLTYNSSHDNVYAEMIEKYNLKEVINKGMCIYGEVYGSKIQKNYSYGCAEGEHKLVIFDVKEGDYWLKPDAMFMWCQQKELPHVTEIYRGPFNIEEIKKICKGKSKMCPEQDTIEGGVIKSLEEDTCYMGRKVLKLINDDYLMKDTTEWH